MRLTKRKNSLNRKILVIAVLFSFVLTACQQSSLKKTEIACLRGPSAISMLYLMEHAQKYNYNVTIYNTPDEIVSKVLKNEVEIAAIPTNLAAILYQKTGHKVKIIAPGTSGALSIVSRDNTIDSVESLKTRTICLAGKGAVPEYLLSHVLQKENISPEHDIKLEFFSGHAQVASLFLAKKYDVAMLPEPFATEVICKDPTIARVLDITKLCDNEENSFESLPMGCIIANENLTNDSVKIQDFLKSYQTSCLAAKQDLQSTALLCEKYQVMSKEVAVLAVPRCNTAILLNANEEIKNLLRLLHEIDPGSIGGTLPNEDFYYN